MRRFNPLLALLLVAGIAAPAAAETIPGSDYTAGQTLGLGYSGLSYDWAVGPASLGGVLALAEVGTPSQRAQIGLRALGRFFHSPDVDAALIGGLRYDPGSTSQHSLLTPDAGVAISTRFTLFPFGLASQTVGGPTFVLRLNVTLAPWSNFASGTQPANFFQSLGLGPNSTIALGYTVNPRLEFTLGGGTIAGMRLHF